MQLEEIHFENAVIEATRGMSWSWKISLISLLIMGAVFYENSSFLYFQHGQTFQPSEASTALLLIMLGKVSLNLYLLRVTKQNHRGSFMGYFCISLAFFDFVLLVMMSFISYFQNFMLSGVRFTEYHICLLAQITAFTYGILHYPVTFLAGLDYYLTITKTSRYPNVCQRSLYTAAVVFMWILVLYYVLNFPGSSLGLDINHYNSAYQCPFYISSQSYWLSLGILILICLVLVLCWSEVVDMVQSIKLISFETETVLFFPYVPECHPRDCAKHLLTRLLICFIGTWAPFVFLQMLIVLCSSQIPAYIEMNVPWLYFVNSFLIGIACWANRQYIELTEESWDVDPFVSWKFCFVPFHGQGAKEFQKPITKVIIC
ncbi:probable G-protein coupled receptor 160 isoform X2 [Elgaria multicarinata webbii]|uniref:probable G-protein coupled receptor 160 isoform X2 n=1 Tax=Elgaria multicarinata webbii TaxID=159646 RepID=UPI002FCD15E6